MCARTIFLIIISFIFIPVFLLFLLSPALICSLDDSLARCTRLSCSSPCSGFFAFPSQPSNLLFPRQPVSGPVSLPRHRGMARSVLPWFFWEILRTESGSPKEAFWLHAILEVLFFGFPFGRDWSSHSSFIASFSCLCNIFNFSRLCSSQGLPLSKQFLANREIGRSFWVLPLMLGLANLHKGWRLPLSLSGSSLFLPGYVSLLDTGLPGACLALPCLCGPKCTVMAVNLLIFNCQNILLCLSQSLCTTNLLLTFALFPGQFLFIYFAIINSLIEIILILTLIMPPFILSWWPGHKRFKSSTVAKVPPNI